MDIIDLKKANEQILKIDNAHNYIGVNVHKFSSIENVVDYLDTIDSSDDAELLTYILATFNCYATIFDNNMYSFIKLWKKYPRKIKWLAKNKLITDIDIKHIIFRAIYSDDLMITIQKNANNVSPLSPDSEPETFWTKYELQNCDIIESFMTLSAALNVDNFIKLLKISTMTDSEKLECLTQRISPNDSDNDDILAQIADIHGIEKLFWRGQLRITNETMNEFDDETLAKIIKGEQ